MPGYNTEADYENAIIELFRNDLGYEYVYGPDVERDFRSVTLFSEHGGSKEVSSCSFYVCMISTTPICEKKQTQLRIPLRPCKETS